MSEGGRYKIVFYGKILDGLEIGEVKRRLAALLAVDAREIDRLFEKLPVTVKKNIDYPTASKLKEALRRAGAVCEIERTAADAGDTAPPPPIQQYHGPASDTRTAAADISVRAIRPGRIWYVIAVLLVTAPAIAAGIKLGSAAWSHFTSGIEFRAPGRTQVTVDRPDTYIVWFTTDDGRSLHRDIPQDIHITVYDSNSRRLIDVNPPRWDGKETVGNVHRQSIAEVVIDRPGVYVIEVSGNFPESDLIWRRSLVGNFFTDLVLPIVIGLLGFGAGLTLALAVFVKRSQAKRHAYPAALSQKEERQWAMFSHLGTFAAFVVPFGNIIAPLIIWQLKKDESAFVVQHSKASLNFQVSLMIYTLASALLVLIFIGVLLLAGLFVFNLIAVIIAGVRANEGAYYKYPMAIRFFK